MSVGPTEPFVIESESEADDYLTDFLKTPKYRSMDEVHMRAAKYIRDEHVKSYFINKAQAAIARGGARL